MHRALKYDFAAAQKTMRDAGLPPEYHDALQNGIWPSSDILPPAEKLSQENSISPQTHFWPDA